MNPIVKPVISLLSFLTLVGDILLIGLVLLLIVSLVSGRKKGVVTQLISFFAMNALPFSLIVASIATAGSLFLSEVAHFIPCKLCWFQRIFMYPQVIILGIALWVNDIRIRTYLFVLSAIGAAIAAYHYALQMFPASLPCTDEVASCAAKQFAQYGYITIPMMALTAFLLMATFMILLRTEVSR